MANAVRSYSEKEFHIDRGTYKHFKGALYFVTGNLLIDCDTQTPMVEYYALYGDYKRSTRPLNRFLEDINVIGVVGEKGALVIMSEEKYLEIPEKERPPLVLEEIVPRFSFHRLDSDNWLELPTDNTARMYEYLGTKELWSIGYLDYLKLPSSIRKQFVEKLSKS